jgi:hypothetical protein
MVYMARLARPVLNYPGNAPWQVVYVASVNGAKALQNLNKAGCSFLTEGRPCRKRAIRYETVSRWLAEGRINATEASVLRTSRRLCFWHAVQFLDAIYPGAKARIYRDNFKRQHRVTHQGLAVMQAMARAGLVKSPGGPHPGPHNARRDRREPASAAVSGVCRVSRCVAGTVRTATAKPVTCRSRRTRLRSSLARWRR